MSHIGGVESSLTVSFIHSRLLLMYSRGGTWRPPVVQSFWEIEIHIYICLFYILVSRRRTVPAVLLALVQLSSIFYVLHYGRTIAEGQSAAKETTF